jgi:16S rRNA (uracil1498-N3)-methyltransferase
MPRFLVPPDLWRGPDVVLPPAESRHLAAVLRVREGDEVAIFDGCGREARARVLASRPDRVALRLLDESPPDPVPVPGLELTLGQAVPKGHGMDEIVRQATELGLARLVPLAAERVIARWSPAEAAARVERWRRVAVSAAKQCGLNRLPEIESLCRPAELAGRIGSFDAAFLGSLRPDARPFRDALADWRLRRPRRVLLMIGPEGDFTEAEADASCRAGAVPVSFGPLVFRVATAALYGLGILRYEFGTSGRSECRNA